MWYRGCQAYISPPSIGSEPRPLATRSPTSCSRSAAATTRRPWTGSSPWSTTSSGGSPTASSGVSGPGHTLGTTGLVHETYVKLVDQTRVEWRDRGHFFRVAAWAMRRILVDYARTAPGRSSRRREQPIHAGRGAVPAAERGELLLALDEALDRLAARGPAAQPGGRVPLLRRAHRGGNGGGAGGEPRTVQRDWAKARGWLYLELGGARSAEGIDGAPTTRTAGTMIEPLLDLALDLRARPTGRSSSSRLLRRRRRLRERGRAPARRRGTRRRLPRPAAGSPRRRGLVVAGSSAGCQAAGSAGDALRAPTRSRASSAGAAWPRSTWPRTSSTTAPSRSRCCDADVAGALGSGAVSPRDRDRRRGSHHPHILPLLRFGRVQPG